MTKEELKECYVEALATRLYYRAWRNLDTDDHEERWAFYYARNGRPAPKNGFYWYEVAEYEVLRRKITNINGINKELARELANAIAEEIKGYVLAPTGRVDRLELVAF